MLSMNWYWINASIILVASLAFLLGKWFFLLGGKIWGCHLIRKSTARRKALLLKVKLDEEHDTSKNRPSPKSDDGDWEKVDTDVRGTVHTGQKADDNWEGLIGFFHPFCDDGGGGERVLWTAIAATQKRWPKATCMVYTGDLDTSKPMILQRVENRFNIRIYHPRVVFICLHTRHYVLSSTYPHFTLLGQSIGSLVLAHEAFSLLVPDIFIDTMGYAFSLALSRFLFPTMPTGAYVHYPTISTDMLDSLSSKTEDGLNAGAGRGWKGQLKRRYWLMFAWMYGWAGSHIDIVMTNSSWTQAHIRTLWGPLRARRRKNWDIAVVFPPVGVAEVEKAVEVSELSEAHRESILLYIAQFRPEKNQALILRAFSQMTQSALGSSEEASRRARLVLVGSVRNSEDATRVYDLRLLAHELKIKDKVEFICDASWPEILDWLRKSSVGVNGMWNEHFGIGVVEYQAAGLICVVNNSGGPKEDIVVDYQGGPTGFYASTASEYASKFAKALSLSLQETIEMRQRARASAKRFTEEAFTAGWIQHMGKLISMRSKTTVPSAESIS